MPIVSVIVPNYNHSRYLAQRLESIFNQTYQDFEVILLDDCSTDDSRMILSEYAEHPKVAHVVFNKTNGGTPFRQWQKGIALAKGQWIWIAESDDYAAPRFLETLIKLIAEQPKAGIAYCGSLWVNDKGQTGKDLSSYHSSFYRAGVEEVKNKLWYVCTIQNASAALIRKDLAADAVGDIINYRSCGDWIFYVKLLQKADLVFTAEKLNYFRYYHNNTSNWAEKNGLWVTEGVELVKHLDFKRLKTGNREFKDIMRFWYNRAKTIRKLQRPGVLLTISLTCARYLFFSIRRKFSVS